MIPISSLPEVNAVLNATSAVLLVAGYVSIKQRKITSHKICMVSAFATSTLFLASYLTYHYYSGIRRFAGTGPIRSVYLTILTSHTILAVVIVPLVLMTLSRAWRGKFDRHVVIARRTLPLWLYVSVTGVVVYWMLYRM